MISTIARLKIVTVVSLKQTVATDTEINITEHRPTELLSCTHQLLIMMLSAKHHLLSRGTPIACWVRMGWILALWQ